MRFAGSRAGAHPSGRPPGVPAAGRVEPRPTPPAPAPAAGLEQATPSLWFCLSSLETTNTLPASQGRHEDELTLTWKTLRMPGPWA